MHTEESVSSQYNELLDSFGGLISQEFPDRGTIASRCLSLSTEVLKGLTPIFCENIQSESALE
jgi:hypothetical protein